MLHCSLSVSDRSYCGGCKRKDEGKESFAASSVICWRNDIYREQKFMQNDIKESKKAGKSEKR